MAHLIGRNVSYKDDQGNEKNDPSDIKNVFPLCRIHHQEYDRNTNSEKRLEWLENKGLKNYSTILKKIVKNY